LHAHLSAANPHARQLVDGQHATAVFHGPHAYVTSRWYNHVNVPTWNYIAVHVSGVVRIMSESELRESLGQLMDHYEAGADRPLTMDSFPDEMIDKYLKGIVGFELKVEKVEGKWKLSQNRDEESFANIIRELEQLDDPGAADVAGEMRSWKLHHQDEER
jgi:transcriptional regulator